jgi:hypothetical protein
MLRCLVGATTTALHAMRDERQATSVKRRVECGLVEAQPCATRSITRCVMEEVGREGAASVAEAIDVRRAADALTQEPPCGSSALGS